MAHSQQDEQCYSLRSKLQPTFKDSGLIVRSQKMRYLAEGMMNRGSVGKPPQSRRAPRRAHKARKAYRAQEQSPQMPDASLQVCRTDSTHSWQEAVDVPSLQAQEDTHETGDTVLQNCSDTENLDPDLFNDSHPQAEPVPLRPRLSLAMQETVQEAFGIINDRFLYLSQTTKLDKEQIINMWFEESRIPCKRFGNSWNDYLAYFRANRKEELEATFQDTGHSMYYIITLCLSQNSNHRRLGHYSPIELWRKCYSSFKARFTHWRAILDASTNYQKGMKTLSADPYSRQRKFKKICKELEKMVCALPKLYYASKVADLTSRQRMLRLKKDLRCSLALPVSM